jgi:Tol biopolymer transport system component
VLAAGVFSWYRLRTAKPVLPAAELLPLTSYPGNEAWPSFSPDGNHVAFARSRQGREDLNIYVKTVGSDNELKLTNTPDLDMEPSWSPDGRQIAFSRFRPDGSAAIYTVSPLGGQERLVLELRPAATGTGFLPDSRPPGGPERPVSELDGDGSLWFRRFAYNGTFHLAWSPDGKWLAYDGRWAFGREIWLLPVADGEKRRLTSPPDGWLGDISPVFSPDGQSLAFVRRKSYGVGDVYTVPVTGGDPRRLTTESSNTIFGLCWTTDGREIVFSSDRSGGQSLWRVPVSGKEAPRRVPEAGEYAVFPSISHQGSRLAYTRLMDDWNIWRVEAPGSQAAAWRPSRFIASTRREAHAEFSPAGTRIAYTSNRSGTWQIWLCDRNGSNDFRLTSVPGTGAQISAWSPDGRSILFNSSQGGDWNIYVVSVEGGGLRRLTGEPSEDAQASWSRDGRWVYFGSNRTGRFEVWKTSAEGASPVQVTTNGGYRPRESRDGKHLLYNRSQQIFDVWKMPVGGGEETLVMKNVGCAWAVAEDGLYIFEQDPDGRWFLKLFDFVTRRKRAVTVLPGVPETYGGISVSPDGKTILYTQPELGEADLMLVENFR